MTQTVEEAIYRLRAEGQRELDQLRSSVDQMVVSEERLGNVIRVSEQSLQNRLARLDPAIKAQEQYRRELEAAQRYADAGIGTENQRLALIDLATRRYREQTAALQALRQANDNLASSSINSAKAINERLSVRSNFGAEGRAKDIEAYGRALDDMRAKFNPVFAAQRAHAQQIEEINHAAKVGAISENERTAAINTSRDALTQQITTFRRFGSESTNSLKPARFELINLSRQIQDVGVSLSGGQSPFQVLIQQGTQIADIMAASNASVGSFFRTSIGWAGRFITSTAGVATGVAGIGAAALYTAGAWTESQRQIERSLIGIGRRSGATVEDINKIATGSASAIGLSIDEARDAAIEFVKTGAIYKDNIKAATDATFNFSIVTGQNAKDAAIELAEALANPAEGADKLNQKLGFLDGQTRQYIISLVNQNRAQEAQRIIIDGVSKSTENAAKTLGFWELQWNRVANAASAAKNAIGSALSGPSNEARRNDLISQRDQLQADIGGGMSGGLPPGAFDEARKKLIALNDEIDRLNKGLEEAAKNAADDRFKKFSIEADNAVKALIPQIKQLEELGKLQAAIRRGQGDSEVGDRQGLAGSNDEAARAAKVLEMNLKNTREETDRANQSALMLARSYGTGSIEVAKMLDALQGQLHVAQAVGQMAQIEAQHRARIVELSRTLSAADATRIASAERAVALAQIEAAHKQTMVALRGQLSVAEQSTGIGQINAQYEATVALLRLQVGEAKAIEQAEAQRAISIAQANANADQMLRNLQQQGELIRAGSDSERDRIRARHTYNNLVDQGVDKVKAAAVANKQLANAEEERERKAREAEEAAIRNIKTQEDAWRAYKESIISWSVANDEAGNVTLRNAAATEELAWWMNRVGEAAQRYNAEAEKFKFLPFHMFDELGLLDSSALFNSKQGGKSQFNPEGYQSKTLMPTNGFNPNNITDDASFDRVLKETGSIAGVVQKLLGDSFTTGATIGGASSTLDTAKLGLLDRAIKLLPSEQQVVAIQTQIKKLQEVPSSLAREELLEQLNDQLKQLTDATRESTQALTDVLSPFYASDPRRTHLGFRAFAGGGIMTAMGEVPLRRYDGGGIANSPQMAVFGEGSTPEAYVPVPSGRIPVEMRAPANNNQPPVIVNVSMTANVSRDEARKTGFQIAQEMKRRLA